MIPIGFIMNVLVLSVTTMTQIGGAPPSVRIVASTFTAYAVKVLLKTSPWSNVTLPRTAQKRSGITRLASVFRLSHFQVREIE